MAAVQAAWEEAWEEAEQVAVQQLQRKEHIPAQSLRRLLDAKPVVGVKLYPGLAAWAWICGMDGPVNTGPAPQPLWAGRVGHIYDVAPPKN